MYQPTELVLQVHRNPPRFLAVFTVAPLTIAPGIEGIFDELALFGIGCNCGSKSFQIFGFPDAGAGLLCPHQIECGSCGKREVLFDVRVHGYDAKLQNGCYSMVGSGEPSLHLCTCGAELFEVVVGVGYQIDPVEDLEGEALMRIQDFFDCYRLESRCKACGVNESVSSYECA